MQTEKITRKNIIRWLKAQDPYRILGTRSNYSCDCVVACYLRDQGYPQADVGVETAWLDGDRMGEGTDLPEEVQRVINTFDHMNGYNHTVREVLAALGVKEQA